MNFETLGRITCGNEFHSHTLYVIYKKMSRESLFQCKMSLKKGWDSNTR
jgi:hypothetical protein